MENKSEKPMRILIIDDNEIVRSSLAGLIEMERDLTVCGQAASGKSGLELARSLKPDLIVLDLSLDDWKGEEVLKKLRGLVASPVLVVSMYDEAIHGLRVLNEGANGYLMKRDAADQIILAIHRVIGGGTYLSPRLAAQTGSKSKADKAQLSPKEAQNVGGRRRG